jgi:hypothetical protein
MNEKQMEELKMAISFEVVKQNNVGLRSKKKKSTTIKSRR